MVQIIDQWEKLKELDEYRPFYDRVKKYFGYMNTGKIWLNQQQMAELFATSKLHNTKRKQLDAQIADAEDIKMLEDWRKAL